MAKVTRHYRQASYCWILWRKHPIILNVNYRLHIGVGHLHGFFSFLILLLGLGINFDWNVLGFWYDELWLRIFVFLTGLFLNVFWNIEALTSQDTFEILVVVASKLSEIFVLLARVRVNLISKDWHLPTILYRAKQIDTFLFLSIQLIEANLLYILVEVLLSRLNFNFIWSVIANGSPIAPIKMHIWLDIVF